MLLWILIVCFVALTVGVGLWGMRRTSTLNDFFLGGRTLNPWVAAFSYGTSYFSAVMFIGFAGKLGWGFGLNVLWISLGNTIFGCLLAWFVLGYRTRRMTQNLNVMTMPEFFGVRYEAPNMKILSAIVIFLFLLPYSASVFQGLGYLFQITLGIDYVTALIFMCVLTAFYLIMGGFLAMTFNDFLLGNIMLIGSAMLFFILTGKVGGVMESVHVMQANYAQHIPQAPPWYTVWGVVFMTSFGVWGLPQMVQKYYAIKDEKQIMRGALVSTVFSFVVVFAAYFMGGMTHVFYTNPLTEEQAAAVASADQATQEIGAKDAEGHIQPVPAPAVEINGHLKLNKAGNPVIDYDRLIPDLMKTQLPEILMAVLVLLVLSASMTTLSSLILVSSSAIAIDLYKEQAHLDDSSKKPLVLIRFLSGLFILISFLIAVLKFQVIVTLMSISWGAVAGAFMAPYIYGLYWKRTTKCGAYAGMITGLAVSLGLLYAWGPEHSPLAASIAMIAPFFVVPVVSLFSAPPSPELLDKAFAPKVEATAEKAAAMEN